MKIRSLLLGSLAVAGLATGARAADLGVLTSLDVCDALGLSGLTISSDTNCLQFSGEIDYTFSWGDYNNSTTYAVTPANSWVDDPLSVDNDGFQGATDSETGYYTLAAGGPNIAYEAGDTLPDGAVIIVPAVAAVAANEDANNDWESEVEAWLTVVGTADSDFGPASATIKIYSDNDYVVVNEGVDDGGDSDVSFDEAYVSIGDSTVIMAGKKGSIANTDDDEPFNYLGLINSEVVDAGVWFTHTGDVLGGNVIQITSDLGNGLSVSAGLENLAGGTDDPGEDGTLVGVLNYAGEGLTAHISAAAVGVLDGEVDEWAVHAGATGTFDAFKVRGAFGYNSQDFGDETLASWNALVSGEATFDMFTIALSGEYATSEISDHEGYGVGGSVGATITDGISINLGARWFHDEEIDGSDDGVDQWQVEAQLVAAITETLTATGAVGVVGGDTVELNAEDDNDSIYYGSLELAWAPGGGFTSSIKGEANSEGAYKATFTASKSFE